ncbi:hypothetical protein IKF94_03040 [Candidatus Saccharibacteria bacterium]|nr:hypothetical protein [Candidatus Saccharibacteria bacterium]
MRNKFFSAIFAILIGTSITACGTTGMVSSETNTTTISTVEKEVIEQPVETNATTNSLAESETEAATTSPEKEVIETTNKGREYTGSLYTLPVAKKGEEWTEAELDDYLKDCKAFHECFDGETFDFEKFIKKMGFEFVRVVDGGSDYTSISRYYYESGSYKIACVLDHYYADVKFYLDNDSDSVCIWERNIEKDEEVIVLDSSIENGEAKEKLSQICVKGIAATIKYLVNSDVIDCARLPYYRSYRFDYGGVGGVLSRDYDPGDGKMNLQTSSNPYSK